MIIQIKGLKQKIIKKLKHLNKKVELDINLIY